MLLNEWSNTVWYMPVHASLSSAQITERLDRLGTAALEYQQIPADDILGRALFLENVLRDISLLAHYANFAHDEMRRQLASMQRYVEEELQRIIDAFVELLVNLESELLYNTELAEVSERAARLTALQSGSIAIDPVQAVIERRRLHRELFWLLWETGALRSWKAEG